MKKGEQMSVPAIGGCSLLVIFGVLCLVIFSLLSLNTVLAEKRISESYARTAAQWYAADLRAQEIFAWLRAGETVDGVERTEGNYRYTVPVSDNQVLLVMLKETQGRWEILSWQTKAYPKDGDTTLPVWRGLEREG